MTDLLIADSGKLLVQLTPQASLKVCSGATAQLRLEASKPEICPLGFSDDTVNKVKEVIALRAKA